MEIKTDLFAEPAVGEVVTISAVEQVTVSTKEGDREAIKVSFEDTEDEVKRSVTLWLSDSSSIKSKLGSFVYALGKNTKNWVGKTIQFVEWSNQLREIVEVTK